VFSKLPPALKHGTYSALDVLPGENRAAFEKLRRELTEELAPEGPLERDIVDNIVRLVWRKQNLTTLRVAKGAQKYCSPWSMEDLLFDSAGKAAHQKAVELGNARRRELGDLHALVAAGEAATIDGLEAELTIGDQLDERIDKCLKRLLHVRGLKSLSARPSSSPQPRIPGPAKAG
jgi:hypothetical protein